MVIHQCVRKLQSEHETDEVHSYNPLPTLWRGLIMRWSLITAYNIPLVKHRVQMEEGILVDPTEIYTGTQHIGPL